MSFLFGGSKPSPEERELASARTEAVRTGLAGAKTDIPAGREALSGPLKLFNALLTGDRNAVMDALSPEIETLHSQYETGRKAVNEFGPRGGGRTAADAELPFREAKDISTLVHGARKEGAAGMTDIAKTLFQLGVGELGGSMAGAQAGADSLAAERARKDAMAQQTGEAIGQLIALIATSA